MILDLTVATTPLGPMALYGSGDELVGLTLDGSTSPESRTVQSLARRLGKFTTRPHDNAGGAVSRLTRYFAGDLRALDEQAVRIQGTVFQAHIWKALREIPAGTTWSYARLAAHIGRPKAVRAAGAANGANHVALFLPCHRVIAADGTLWGYGGGLPRKAWLLRHEGASAVANLEQQALPFA